LVRPFIGSENKNKKIDLKNMLSQFSAKMQLNLMNTDNVLFKKDTLEQLYFLEIIYLPFGYFLLLG